jgi:hypothetical protein
MSSSSFAIVAIFASETLVIQNSRRTREFRSSLDVGLLSYRRQQ